MQHTLHWHSTTAHTLCHYSAQLLTCYLCIRPCWFWLWVQILLIIWINCEFHLISTTSLHNQRFIAVTVISVKFSLSSFSSFLSASGWLHQYLVQSCHITSAQLFCSCVFTGMAPFLLLSSVRIMSCLSTLFLSFHAAVKPLPVIVHFFPFMPQYKYTPIF